MLRLFAVLIAALVATAPARGDDACAPELRQAVKAEVDAAGHLYVPLEVDGRTVKALFCTTCAWSSLSARFVGAAGIETRRDGVRYIDQAGNTFDNFVRAKTVKLGEVAFSGEAQFLVDDRGDEATFGVNLMANFDIEIDNAKGVISLYRYAACRRPALPWIKDAVEIPFRTDNGYPEGVVNLRRVLDRKDRPVLARFSTGVTHSAIGLDVAAYQLGVTPDTRGVQRIALVRYGEKTYDRYSCMLPALSVSGLQFKNVPMNLVGMEKYGLDLGMHELRLLRLYFAFDQKKLYAAPAAAR